MASKSRPRTPKQPAATPAPSTSTSAAPERPAAPDPAKAPTTPARKRKPVQAQATAQATAALAQAVPQPKAKAKVKEAAAPATAPVAVPPATPAAPEGAGKKTPKPRPVLVRDSFTMPEADFALIAKLKTTALRGQRAAKKSELLRAGLQLLASLDTESLVVALNRLDAVKTGRPRKGH